MYIYIYILYVRIYIRVYIHTFILFIYRYIYYTFTYYLIDARLGKTCCLRLTDIIGNTQTTTTVVCWVLYIHS